VSQIRTSTKERHFQTKQCPFAAAYLKASEGTSNLTNSGWCQLTDVLMLLKFPSQTEFDIGALKGVPQARADVSYVSKTVQRLAKFMLIDRVFKFRTEAWNVVNAAFKIKYPPACSGQCLIGLPLSERRLTPASRLHSWKQG
jgi:hypothetical protein